MLNALTTPLQWKTGADMHNFCSVIVFNNHIMNVVMPIIICLISIAVFLMPLKIKVFGYFYIYLFTNEVTYKLWVQKRENVDQFCSGCMVRELALSFFMHYIVSIYVCLPSIFDC